MSTTTRTATETSAVDSRVLRQTVLSLAGGTFLVCAGVASLVWVYGALRFALDGVVQAFGVVTMTVLAFLLFTYAWALLARGFGTIIAQAVAEGTTR